MFGRLPAYGLYCRHVRGLKLSNVQLQLAGADKRHAVVFEDVHNAMVDGLDAAVFKWGGFAASPDGCAGRRGSRLHARRRGRTCF